VVQLNDERFWLHAAVAPETNRLLHVEFAPPRIQATTEMFLAESREKYLVDDALFLVDSAPWLQASLPPWPRLQIRKHRDRNSIECTFRELKLGGDVVGDIYLSRIECTFENSSVEPTSSQTALATSKQILSKIDFKHLPSHETRLSKHYHGDGKTRISAVNIVSDIRRKNTDRMTQVHSCFSYILSVPSCLV